MSGVFGALADAWSELRHHKLRVLLSLIGIAVSVGAIAAVVAIGDFQRQSAIEQSDRFGGRNATISVSANSTGAVPLNWQEFDERVQGVFERFGFDHASRFVDNVPFQVQSPEEVKAVTGGLIDPAYPVIHRSEVLAGRWFRASDTEMLAPPVVISQALWDAFGRPDLGEFVLRLEAPFPASAPVIGVTPAQYPGDTDMRMTMLYGSYVDRVDALPADAFGTWEVWLPESMVPQVGPALASDLRAGLQDIDVAVSRTDWGSRPEMAAQTGGFELVTGGIAALVLALGGLGLVNIQLVAMRQRIREIGIRRSFGATGGRIFTSVLLESVVATTVAGVAGIALAVAVMRAPFVLDIFPDLQDVPAFPLRAALVGLAAAVAIGALAGFIPAMVAVRAKVIEALRF